MKKWQKYSSCNFHEEDHLMVFLLHSISANNSFTIANYLPQGSSVHSYQHSNMPCHNHLEECTLRPSYHCGDSEIKRNQFSDKKSYCIFEISDQLMKWALKFRQIFPTGS